MDPLGYADDNLLSRWPESINMRIAYTYPELQDGETIYKELPFVVGVVGDFSGGSGLPTSASSQFLEITSSNAVRIMREMVGPEALNVDDPPRVAVAV